VGLAAVRDIRPQLRLETPDEVGAFEQDLLAEFVLARASAGITDTTISADVAAVVGLREWFGRPLWELAARDLDRFFGADQRAMAPGTKVRKAESPLDEVNRPRGGTSARLRIPPGQREIEKLFTGWRTDMLTARKYAPAARNYTAMRLASLIGPRVSELCLLTMRDVCWDLGRFGKILLHGKGSRGRGKKDRLVPLINGSRDLLEWWAGGPRWEFDDRVNDPAAPLFPSERRHGDGSSRPVTDDALRTGLAEAVAAHLPGQAGRLTPHLLRHYAASELYRNGMDVFAVQEVLGHEWINTTMIYVHVHRSHVEDAWVQAGCRAAGRLGGEPS
jgi:site-specific recombinase XerD